MIPYQYRVFLARQVCRKVQSGSTFYVNALDFRHATKSSELLWLVEDICQPKAWFTKKLRKNPKFNI